MKLIFFSISSTYTLKFVGIDKIFLLCSMQNCYDLATNIHANTCKRIFCHYFGKIHSQLTSLNNFAYASTMHRSIEMLK